MMNDELKAVEVLARFRTEDYGGRWLRENMNSPDVCYEVISKGNPNASISGVLESMVALEVPFAVHAYRWRSEGGVEVEARVYMGADSVPKGARVELDNGNHYIEDGTRHRCRCGDALEWDHDCCPSCVVETVEQGGGR